MIRRGVYFLANDPMIDLVITFLNSLRAQEPDIALCLIPYDDRTTRIRELASRYCFSVLDDVVALSACDEISSRFHGRIRGHYRKIAAWSGVFDEFVYIDIDTVLLKPLVTMFA